MITALSSMSCWTFCSAAMLSAGVDDEKNRLKKDIEKSRFVSLRRCKDESEVKVRAEEKGADDEEIDVEVGVEVDGEICNGGRKEGLLSCIRVLLNARALRDALAYICGK